MSSEVVTIKGISDGLLISLDPVEEWQRITQEIAARIDEKPDFFAGARITVNVAARPVPKYEMSSLKALLERRGLTLMAVQSSSNTTIEAATSLDIRTIAPQMVGGEDLSLPIDPEEQGTKGTMIRKTLRSGRTVHSRGHVVVVGDVNPGAQVIATGDIVIWGRLRGMVHAGAEGDENSIVCALDMNPNQLRIAGLIVTSPKEKNRRPKPEVASIRDGGIVVEVWKPA